MSPTSPGVAYYQQSPQVYDNYTSLPTYPSEGYLQADRLPGSAFDGNMETATPVYVTQISESAAQTYMAPTSYLDTPFSPQAIPTTIKTEARKIVITQLPHSISYHDVEKLLLKYIARSMSKPLPNDPANELEELTIQTSPDKKTRGHAFAIIGTEQLAKSVVKSLDGVQFHGRLIKSRLAKEGVTARSISTADPYLMPAPLYYQSQGPPAAQLSPQQIERPAAVEDSCARTTAVTASGTEGKSTRKSKEGSSEKKTKGSSPAVVNGSSSGSSRGRDEKCKKYRSSN